MKAIILAAGQGIRLSSVTREPKCLYKINNFTILERQVRLLRKNGIDEIYIVTGYKSESIRKFSVNHQLNLNFIYNKEWNVSDNLYSLYLAIQIVKEGFILLNADVVFDERMLRKLIKCSGHDISVVGKNEFKIGKFSDRGRIIILAILNAIQNWRMAQLRLILKLLNVHYLTARYFCNDIDYPKDVIKMREKLEETENPN